MSEPVTHAPADVAPTANGAHPAPEADPLLARAGRILAGDVRDDDYLPVPAELLRELDEHYRQAAEETGFDASPAIRQNTLNNWTLDHHHDGNVVLARFTDLGVIVLAAGHPDIYRVRMAYNTDYRSGFALMFPDTTL